MQDTDSVRFSNKLTAVFAVCHQVLKDEGLLVFSYHHTRKDGWIWVAAAVLTAGFKLALAQAQSVKAEMSTAMPKLAAKSPIDLDLLMVCRKAADDRRPKTSIEAALQETETTAEAKVRRFNRTGRRLSLNDVRIVVFSPALVELCAGRETGDTLQVFEASMKDCAAIAQRLHGCLQERPDTPAPIAADMPVQASLY